MAEKLSAAHSFSFLQNVVQKYLCYMLLEVLNIAFLIINIYILYYTKRKEKTKYLYNIIVKKRYERICI